MDCHDHLIRLLVYQTPSNLIQSSSPKLPSEQECSFLRLFRLDLKTSETKFLIINVIYTFFLSLISYGILLCFFFFFFNRSKELLPLNSLFKYFLSLAKIISNFSNLFLRVGFLGLILFLQLFPNFVQDLSFPLKSFSVLWISLMPEK